MAEESSKIIDSTLKSIKTKPYLIGISGGSASGKTSVAQIIFKLIGIQDCNLISLDSYYKVLAPEQYANLSEYNFDHPNAFDWDLVLQNLNDLLESKEIEMPVYNFTVSRREPFTHKVRPCNLIIFEGILAFYDKRVRNLMDMKIFVDTDSDVRLARRGNELKLLNIYLVYRDIKDRGRNLQNVILRYHKFVKPAFDEYIKPTIKMADVVIPRGAENTVAIDLVSQHLKYQLAKILGSSLDVKKSNSSIMVSNHEIIDPKYQFLEGKIIVHEDVSQVELLKEIFEDFLNGKNISYYKIFIENMLNSLIGLYYKQTSNFISGSDIFLTEFDNFSLSEDPEIKKVVLYKHMILSEADCEVVQKFLAENNKCEFNILTTFLSPKFADLITSNNQSVKITFTTLYYSDYLLKYQKYIENGGLIDNVKEEDGYLRNEFTLFTKENFSDNFRMSWKNNTITLTK